MSCENKYIGSLDSFVQVFELHRKSLTNLTIVFPHFEPYFVFKIIVKDKKTLVVFPSQCNFSGAVLHLCHPMGS